MPASKGRAVQTRRMTKAQRADFYRALYFALGGERSIKVLWEYCGAIGVERPSVKTLENYSRTYGWVQAAQEFDERTRPVDVNTNEAYLLAMEMDAKHVKVGQAMQAKGAAALAATRDADVSASAAAQLLRHGVMIERLAGGMATSRVEFTVEHVNSIISVMTTETDALLSMFEDVPQHIRDRALARFAQNVDDGISRILDRMGVPVQIGGPIPAGTEG